ncbi:translation initiation factor 2 [Pseudomonas sp. LS44]|uniref:translation initiation factor 2 n=1 Tax=Pseudomonas sp. LS44 TaxID=1357074 RepID=UPI00215AAA91|nr:translation initiation factor 2 [Pseudomonas sp. LS44]UVE19004.1 translation initiation factor 2 [Pseudomonas sp. LS44]
MRHSPLPLLFATLLLAPPLQAEEAALSDTPTPTVIDAGAARINELEQRLADSEQRSADLASQLQSNVGERESAQLSRLRQENQRLKLQLKQTQAEQQPQLLNDRQQWFAAGGGVGLLGVMLGTLLRGRRKSRREWLN